MKKSLLFLILCVSLSLMPGCAGAAEHGQTPLPDEPPGKTDSPVVIEDGAPWLITCRIVDGAETGQLVLAENGGAGSGVYTLSLDQLCFEFQLAEPLRSGQLINVYFETVMETYPAQFGGVSAVELVEGGFDDRAALYLDVLKDLWAVDSGLNDGVEVIGVDLSQTSLSPAEQAAVAWVFTSSHDAELAEGSLEELIEQGWITATPLSGSGSGTDLREPKHYFYEWENGCHFSITEQPMEGVYSLTPVTFDAMKWRSSLGAYFFSDCTAVQSALGAWSEYQIGAEMIS